MRRVSIALMVCSVALALAIPAGAAKPDCGDPHSTHLACQDPGEAPEVVNDSCYAHGEWGPHPVAENFVVTLGGRNTAYPSGYCIDVLATPGNWTVEIETAGKVQSVNLFMRDSVGAGDGCFTAPDGTSSCGYMFRSNDIPAEQVFEGIPGAWANACGDEWGEYVGSFWGAAGSFNVGKWYTTEDTDVVSPLAFLPGIRAGSDATVKLIVRLPGATNDPVPIEWPQD
jgi:hypothetical protein